MSDFYSNLLLIGYLAIPLLSAVVITSYIASWFPTRWVRIIIAVLLAWPIVGYSTYLFRWFAEQYLPKQVSQDVFWIDFLYLPIIIPLASFLSAFVVWLKKPKENQNILNNEQRSN